MNESDGSALSVLEQKRLRGSLPVEENRETRLGCTEDENIVEEEEEEEGG